MRTVILDNEAVQALRPGHVKHRVVVAHLAGVVERRRKGVATRIVVPTAVRVEAGWDRSSPSTGAISRVADIALDTRTADIAAEIVQRTGVGVADGQVGAVVRGLATDEVVVLTSDPDDMRLVSAPKALTAIRI